MFWRMLKGLLLLYVFIWLVLGVMNYKTASSNFYAIDRHFALYLSANDKISKSIIKGSWCALIAQPEFLDKTTAEREAFAREFFDDEIAPLASEQAYDLQQLKEWFMRYAWWKVEDMPVKEFMLDWKGDDTVLYRTIDLTEIPKRKLSYFFFSEENLKDSFWAALVVGLPFFAVFFTIRRYLYGTWM